MAVTLAPIGVIEVELTDVKLPLTRNFGVVLHRCSVIELANGYMLGD